MVTPPPEPVATNSCFPDAAPIKIPSAAAEAEEEASPVIVIASDVGLSEVK